MGRRSAKTTAPRLARTRNALPFCAKQSDANNISEWCLTSCAHHTAGTIVGFSDPHQAVVLKWWSSQRPASEDKAASTVVGRQSRRCTTRAHCRYARNSNDPKGRQDGSSRRSTGSCRRWYRSHWARDPIHQAELRQVTGASHSIPALRSAVRAVLEQRGRLTTFSAKGSGRAGRGSLW